jgi:hypothetical protein
MPKAAHRHTDDFDSSLERALKVASDEAANEMLLRGQFISYREHDTPPGHVIREYPDGTKVLVKVDLKAALAAE